MSLKEATPQQTHQSLQEDNVLLLDVRSPGEYAGIHADGAINMPLDQCDAQQIHALAQEHGVKLVHMICQSGQRAKMACDKVMDDLEGESLVLVTGGTTAWEQNGLPVVRGKGVISIERQMRIGAGLLVAAGTALGFGMHEGFYLIPAFVGCGLFVAGVTNTCMMGLILAKMPWNTRVSTSCSVQPPN